MHSCHIENNREPISGDRKSRSERGEKSHGRVSGGKDAVLGETCDALGPTIRPFNICRKGFGLLASYFKVHK